MSTTRPVVGYVGLGRLGLPLAVSVASRGYKVLGYDHAPALMQKRQYEHRECGPDGKTYDFQKYFDEADLTFLPLKDLLSQADIVFVVVQTPHGPEYEGTTRLPFSRADFNYTYLRSACEQISKLRTRLDQVIVICSTALPGTMRREVLPLIPDCVYNPSFPAMTTVMRDFLNPEFVLLGGDDQGKLQKIADFYDDLLDHPNPGWWNIICKVSIESAELAKVSYNTIITAKTVIANNIMEVAHRTPGCSCDEVIDVLQHAYRRLWSPAYMHGGMGDGGGCHPRDNIAMSWLSEKLKCSATLFDDLMMNREYQTEWLANLFINHSNDRPKVLLGKAYKEGTSITTGSCAILLANILTERGVAFEHYDPFVDDGDNPTPFETRFPGPHAFFIATKHDTFNEYNYPAGSVIIDPFRYITQPRPGVKVIPIGIGR